MLRLENPAILVETVCFVTLRRHAPGNTNSGVVHLRGDPRAYRMEIGHPSARKADETGCKVPSIS